MPHASDGSDLYPDFGGPHRPTPMSPEQKRLVSGLVMMSPPPMNGQTPSHYNTSTGPQSISESMIARREVSRMNSGIPIDENTQNAMNGNNKSRFVVSSLNKTNSNKVY